MIENTILERHKKEYSEACVYIRENILASKGRMASPKGFSLFVAKCFDEASKLKDASAGKAHFLKTLGDKPRKIHDYFGWKSLTKKGKKEDRLSVCKGAIYRTREYMSIDCTERSGAKVDKEKPFGVHIEHTIPCSEIKNYLWESRASLKNAHGQYCSDRIQNQFFDISVCTAMSRTEEKSGILKGFSKKHPELVKGFLHSIESIYLLKPFIRYSDNIEIYEMVTGQQIDSNEWTIADHKKLLEETGIYYSPNI